MKSSHKRRKDDFDERGEFSSLPSFMISDEIKEVLPYLKKNMRIEQGDGLYHALRSALVSRPGGMFLSCKTIFNITPPEEDLLTWRTHGVLCLLSEDEGILKFLCEYPRKSLKTSIVTIRKKVHRLVKRCVMEEDPADRFFFMSHGFTVAQKIWWDCREIFESEMEGPRLFRFLIPELRLDPDRWNDDHGCVLRDWQRRDWTFQPLAKRNAGKHTDGGSCDDLIDEENYDEPGQVEKAIMMFRQTRNINEGPKSWIDVPANRWGLNDLNSHIHTIANRDKSWVVLSVDVENGPRWDGEYGCKNIPEYAEECLEAMTDCAEKYGTIWPERFTKKYLKELREELGPAIYSAQFKNLPEDPENQDFDSSMIGFAKWVDVGEEKAIEISGGGLGGRRKIIFLSDVNAFVGWDPAADGKRGKSKNAIVGFVRTCDDEYIVVKEHVRKESPLKSMRMFVAFAKMWRGILRGSGVEEVNFQKIFKDLSMTLARKLKVALMLKKVKTPTGKSKEQRVRAVLSSIVESGKLYMMRGCKKTYDSVRLFGTIGAEDDPADALAMGISISFKPLTKREQDDINEESDRVEQERGLTGYGSSLDLGGSRR